MSVTLPLDEMTVEEKLQIMEALWENLSCQPDLLKSPAWHGEVLGERQRQVATGETHFIPWEESRENLRQRAAARKP